MRKFLAQSADANRSGYGPLIIPPLVIITVLSFGFIYMESLLLAPSKQPDTTASSTKPTTENQKKINTTITPTDYKQFDSLQTITPAAPSVASAPVTAPTTTSPQPTATSTSGNSLQSAAQNSKKNASDLSKTINNALNTLRVNTSSKQNLTNNK